MGELKKFEEEPKPTTVDIQESLTLVTSALTL